MKFVAQFQENTEKRCGVGTDGQPQGPHPHAHILPCPYYIRPWRAASSYRRGGPLWSPNRHQAKNRRA